MELFQCVRNIISHIFPSSKNVFQITQETVCPCTQVIDGHNGIIHIILCSVYQIIRTFSGFIGHSRNVVQTERNVIHGGFRMIQHTVHNVLQTRKSIRKPFQVVLTEFQNQIRFHLPNDTAYVFSAVNTATVFAVMEITRLSAGNTAYVIPYMGITNFPCILASLQKPRGKSRNTARICIYGKIFCIVDMTHINIIQCGRNLRSVCIDAAFIGTADDAAKVLPSNTAGIVFPANFPANGTSCDNPCIFIDAGNAANIVFAVYHTVEHTIFNGAAVVSYNTANGAFPARWLPCACNCQVFHHCAFAHIAEYPCIRSR
ncbi:unknown [Clostridium sp. CAG:505]|nr:unknown [Clostridium sp. CAG:505]